MKYKVLLGIGILVMLTGCGEPNTTEPARKSRASEALQLTPGLEHCNLYSFSNGTSNHEINIVRCLEQDTISINKIESRGKTTKQTTTIVIDGKTYIQQ